MKIELVFSNRFFGHRGIGEKEVLNCLNEHPSGISKFGIAKRLNISLRKTQTILSDLEIDGKISFSEINPHKTTRAIRVYYIVKEKNKRF